MTRDRFQRLLRRIRIFNPADFPDTPKPSEQQRRGQARKGLIPKVYRQVNGWSAHIQETGESFYTPGTGLTVDEAIVQFTGRSTETTTVPNKPTPVDFKRVVTTLVALLPAAGYHVFLDNLFASVKLFRALRRQNIGTTSTYQKDGGIDEILVDEKEEEGKGIPWGKVHCIPTKDGEINQFTWKDNALVLFLTTVFRETSEVLRLRRRPTGDSAAKEARRVFGAEARKILPISLAIDD
ncbi:hypothetical protein CSOJ01_06228 [Colletotrichum sojae]|uniref:PiggyBac transposable element-derived protein domain-containing protein n=1 Tax=Colletotrichum sojae TaxID=2175907 RepID=A0A8H6JDF7_9PEZI|nr:hypothetical protein CSOJ01_06228 [Colletotrichum sojae]